MNRYLIVQDHGYDGYSNVGVLDAPTAEDAYALAKVLDLLNIYCDTEVYDVMKMYTYRRPSISFIDGGVDFERGV